MLNMGLSPESLRELGNFQALFIGINNYDNISSLKYSINDAEELFNLLSDEKYSISDKSNLTLITDKTKVEPRRTEIITSLRILCDRCGPENDLLFYFAGHAGTIEGKSFLFPSDYNEIAAEESAINIEEFKNTISESDARFKLIILDACHTGTLEGRAQIGQMTPLFFNTLFPPAKGMAIITACQKDQTSIEHLDYPHGVFTYYLIEGAKGKADKDGDFLVGLFELFTWIQKEVKKYALSRNKIQRPEFSTGPESIAGDFKFTKIPFPSPIKWDNIITEMNLTSQTYSAIWTDFYDEFSGWEEDTEEKIHTYLEDFLNKIIMDITSCLLGMGYNPSDIAGYGSEIRFPIGETYEYIHEDKNEKTTSAYLLLETYLDKDLSKIDKFMNGIDDMYNNWYKISYNLSCKLNPDVLKEIADEKEYGFKYLPKKTTLINNKLINQTLLFIFEDVFTGTKLSIIPEKDSSLDNNFFVSLNPVKIFEIIEKSIIL